jgi:GTP cyclohydrolase I
VDGEEGTRTLRPAPRTITDEQWARYQGYMAEIFAGMGMTSGAPGTRDTPRRFLEAMYDATSGYEGDSKIPVSFPNERHDAEGSRSGQIVQGPIPFHALCEHHALPFHGHAYVGYIARTHIIGISKLVRLVRLFARRFTVQERIAHEIAGALQYIVEPHGVAVHLDAVHLCTQMRGVRDSGSRTLTNCWLGAYEMDSEIRREFAEMWRTAPPA